MHAFEGPAHCQVVGVHAVMPVQLLQLVLTSPWGCCLLQSWLGSFALALVATVDCGVLVCVILQLWFPAVLSGHLCGCDSSGLLAWRVC
jgi:hypothetical protein